MAYPNMVNAESLGAIKAFCGVLGMDVGGYDFTGTATEGECFGSDFHQLSQDLRNPLNSISGFAELLLMDEGLSPAHADYVRAILTGSAALTAAVVSILDRAEERDPSCAAAPVSQPAPRRSLLARAGRWGAQRRLLCTERSGTL